jgi:hypothetical protein
MAGKEALTQPPPSEKPFLGRVWDASKPPPDEKGVLGPIDQVNRFSYRFSKPAAIGTGVATLFVPAVWPAFLVTGVWAGGDKAAIEGSKWARRKLTQEKKSGNSPDNKMRIETASHKPIKSVEMKAGQEYEPAALK